MWSTASGSRTSQVTANTSPPCAAVISAAAWRSTSSRRLVIASLRAELEEALAHRAAQPRAAAGDHDNFAFEQVRLKHTPSLFPEFLRHPHAHHFAARADLAAGR